MRKLPVFLFAVLCVALAFGCSGTTTTLHMQNPKASDNVVVFPNGTAFGGASKDQASALARIFVDSHNMSIQELSELKGMSGELIKGQKESLKNQEALQKSTQQLLASTEMIYRKNSETAENALKLLEYLSKRQGTGEITLFFPTGSSRLHKDSLEYKRLISFIDYLARENRGRKLLFISIGCSSATGDRKFNHKLAKNRAEFPIDVIDKYLVNTPHEFFKIYGTGDIYSPENVKMKEHKRYQHARLIAVYETDQVLELPVEPTAEKLSYKFIE